MGRIILPSVVEPERWKYGDLTGLFRSIGYGNSDAYVVGRYLGIRYVNVEVMIIIEYTGIEDLVFGFVP